MMRTLALLLDQRQRRDWVQLSIWILGTALLAYSSYIGVRDSYGTEQDRQSLLLTVLANPVVMLFRGLPSGAGDGSFMLFLIFPFLAMMAAFMSTFLAVRHTRAEEETGRAELVGATGAGRIAPLLATIVHGVLANLVLGVLVAVSYLTVGLPADGSWIAGLGAAMVGVSFLGIGLIAGQLMPTPRSANSLAVWVLMITFLLAGIGNALGTADVAALRVDSSWLTMLSPFGWGEQTRAFAENNVWPIVVCAVVGLVLAALAGLAQARRDVGASLLPERRGRATARPLLRSPLTLAWQLNSGAILGWAIGGMVTGLLATSLASVLADAAGQNPAVEALMRQLAAGGSLAEAAVIVFFTMLGVFAAAVAVQIMAKARQEEVHGTAELVLASPIGRVRWLSGYLVVAIAGIVVTIAAAVLGALLGLAGQATPDWALVSDVLWVGAGQGLAALVFAAGTALIFVLAPRLTIGLGWTLVGITLVLGLFGPLFGFPDWLVHLAPIASAPTSTNGELEMQGGLWLGLTTLVLGSASILLMRWRELAAD